MTTYFIEAIRRTYLRAEIEAATRQEAFEIVDKEYIDDDFEVMGSDFTFTHGG
tara:strand:+ start:259 stop:417 length:159 start_codon:yes stop_codon:yes gene_type:complete